MSAAEAPLTPRERLIRQLRNPGPVGLDEYDADQLIGEYATELAGEIRATRDDMAVPGIEPEFLDGMSYAANGIDPNIYERERPQNSEGTAG
jgi:hypothetical protein